MKCNHCGGTLIYHPGNCLERAVVKCMACGREGMKNMESEMKKCSKCLDEKLFEEFSINRSNPDGHEYVCKDCMKKKMQVYRDLKAGLEHGPAKRGRKTTRRAKIRPACADLPARSVSAEAGASAGRPASPTLRRAGKPSPTITRATSEQIIADLRRGLAIEIIDMIQEKFGV